jgi:hypothetical protein
MSYELEEYENEKAPLTKPRKSKQKVEPIIEPIVEQDNKPIEPPIEPKPKKPRAPKTEKQIEVFKEKCALARKNNIKKQKDTIVESAKTILKKELKKEKKQDTESEDEPEVIHITKPKRKPKKKIIVVHSDSSSESSSSSEEEHITKKQFGKSHRNKKSITVQQPKQNENTRVVQKLNNFFAD